MLSPLFPPARGPQTGPAVSARPVTYAAGLGGMSPLARALLTIFLVGSLLVAGAASPAVAASAGNGAYRGQVAMAQSKAKTTVTLKASSASVLKGESMWLGGTARSGKSLKASWGEKS